VSTIFLLLAACVHLGTVPVGEGWNVVAAHAPVVEPGVDEAVRGAVVQALAARQAAGPAPLHVWVERADWRPGRRTGDTVIYDATLAVRFVAGARERTVTASRPVPDPGTAGAAVEVRAAAFLALARQAADEGVAWLVLGG